MTDVGVSGNSSGLGMPSVFWECPHSLRLWRLGTPFGGAGFCLELIGHARMQMNHGAVSDISRGREVQTAMPAHMIMGNRPTALYGLPPND